MYRRYFGIGILWLIGFVPSGMGQANQTEHTLRFSQSDPRPKATLQDIAWLQGAWEGPAFSGTSEEIWSEPLAGTMMGVYRSIEGGVVKFYEINSIVEINGSLEMRLKHFHPDLTGWEEKDATRNFPLINLGPDEIYFDGMTYRRISEDTLTVYLAVGSGESLREVTFQYRRLPEQKSRKPNSISGDSEQVLQTLDRLAQAGLRRDIQEMKELYDPEYFHTNSDGSVMELVDVLKSYQAPTPYRFNAQRAEERHIILQPPVAVVNQVVVLHGTKEGAGEFTSRYRVTYILRQSDSGWKVLNSHASLLGIQPEK
jgi:hypothetical protein